MSGGLVFRHAEVGYGVQRVVTAADLAVAPGELVGLVGPNGAGKSTLLRVVTGAADLLNGSVTVDGRDLAGLASRERARLVAVVPQELPAPFAFRAREFVEMGRHPWLGRLQPLRSEDVAAVAEAMERTDTARLADERVDTLSGGDLQRLTVAQALAQRSRVLLLDEPTSHLDLDHRLQVLEVVRRLADDGMAVLGVFHDLDMAARYADRIAVVADGRLRPALPPAEALSAAMVEDVFGVAAVVAPDPVTGSITVTPVVRRAEVAAASRGRVGIVCGAGSGAALMRRLSLAGFSLSCGALSEGDVDAAVARALGAELMVLPAFAEVDAAAERAVAAAFASCGAVVVAGAPFGRANVGNLRAALAAGRPLVLVGRMDAARDFSAGEASGLWRRALDAGARRADTVAEAAMLAEALVSASGRGEER